jgi:hypothetical protein
MRQAYQSPRKIAMHSRIDACVAPSTPRWTYCDRCNSNTLVEFDVLVISMAGVQHIETRRGCVKEYQDKQRSRDGL